MKIRNKKIYRDAKGVDIPARHVRKVDRARDYVAESIVKRAMELRRDLEEFKADAINRVREFERFSAEESGVTMSPKGNVTVTTFDHSMKVEINVQNYIDFDERLQHAKSIIDDLLNEWTEEARTEVQEIVRAAFNTDKKGQVNKKEILGLRKLKFGDPRWRKAISLIDKSITIHERKSYVRFYVRDPRDENRWNSILLDIAKVSVADVRVD